MDRVIVVSVPAEHDSRAGPPQLIEHCANAWMCVSTRLSIGLLPNMSER